MLVERLCYYHATLFWIRAIHLKWSNKFLLVDNEVKLMDMFEGTLLNTSEPIALYLNVFGTLEDVGTGQSFIATFPDLPEQVVNGVGSNWSQLCVETHNFYEEYPSLEVHTEGVRRVVSDAAAGLYPNTLAAVGLMVNTNLQGFRPLANSRNEAKNFFLEKGITNDQFFKSIPNMAINYTVISAVSGWLATLTTSDGKYRRK